MFVSSSNNVRTRYWLMQSLHKML